VRQLTASTSSRLTLLIDVVMATDSCVSTASIRIPSIVNVHLHSNIIIIRPLLLSFGFGRPSAARQNGCRLSL